MVGGFLLFASSASAYGPDDLDAGLNHTCFVTPAATVKCWGDNEHGQLGDGSTTERHAPVEVSGLSGVIEVSAGDEFTCALTGEGDVWCWGDNEHGQIGDGTTTDRHVPTKVSGLPAAVEIAAGGDHACAITETLHAWCWGSNGHGQLGDGTTTDRHSPVEVHGLPEAGGVAVGGKHTCASTEGDVWCWGDNEHGQLGDGTTTDSHLPVEVKGLSGTEGELVAGGEHTCADAEKKVWCWGDNEHGQLGDGTTTDRHVPVEVTGLPSGGAALSAGGSFTCAFSYFTWCWGDNEHGQLGDETTNDSHVPVNITSITSEPGVGAVAAGGSHACYLNNAGDPRCWGDDEHGQLGNGSTSVSSLVTAVKTLSGPLSVATGGSTSCAVTAAGTVKCWGQQEGPGVDSSSPTEIPGLTGVTGIGVAADHSCALTSQTGKVWCWGDNEHGQLGDGTTTDRPAPVEVVGLSTASAVAAGDHDTCVVTEAGKAECWGDNEHGQLGDGTTTDRHGPVEVGGLAEVTEVSAGAEFACALTADGEVWCWGANERGQLGDGTTTDRHLPVEVSGLPAAVEVTAGGDHACAITEAGQVWCWGANEHGQLGDGTTTDRHVPTEVPALSGATQITAGADHTCAILTAAGEPFDCWGDNEHGQLSDGIETVDRHSPTGVLYLAESSMLAAGGSHTCALLRTGLVECWGANEHGQLGDGTHERSTSPVPAVVERKGQRVLFQTFGELELGEPDLRFSAESTANTFVTSTSLTPSVCKVVLGERGPQLHLVGLGECKLVAEQAGTAKYAPGVPVERRLQVGLAPGTGALSGRVTAETGGHAPLSGVLVCALKSEEEEEVEGQNCELTDDEGNYLIANLPLGTYKVEFRPPHPGTNYVAQFYEEFVSWSEAKPLAVTETLTEGIDAELREGGEISGRVTALSTGEPLGNVLVCAEDVDREFEECEETGPGGSYRITGLTLGAYEVSFLVPEGEGFRSQAYKGKSDPSEADIFEVRAGQEVEDVDAALESEATVTGYVVDAATGGGLAEVEVCAFELTGLEFEICELTGSSGDYELPDLPVGEYKITFFDGGASVPLQYWNAEPSWETAKVLTLHLGTVASGIDASFGVAPEATHLPLPHQHAQAPTPGISLPTHGGKVQPKQAAPKHCPAGKKRKKVDGESRCVKPRKKGHHKQRHRGTARVRRDGAARTRTWNRRFWRPVP